MTTTAQPTPPPVVTVPVEHRRKTRAIPVTVGAVLATAGTFLALAGGGVLAAAGDDGTIGSGDPHDVSTRTSALVTGAADLDSTSEIASALGQPKIGVTVTAKDGEPDKFVGIGRANDVDRYLAGVDVERVTDANVGSYKLDKKREGGNASATAPTAQSFWVAQSAGHKADVNWKVRDGSYKVVVMNADGSRGVKADGHFEAGLPYLSTAALTAMLLGLIAIGGGTVLIARNASVPATPNA
jgi:hypothetical protein